jgi:glucose-1-phosphate adenylyltransferase
LEKLDMRDVFGVILGGGRGTRLYPLTRDRTKPAVPLAGKYRLIDIPMSNCYHAGIDKIAILTQFQSVSLHRHIHRTYNPDMFTTGFVEILAAEQSHQNGEWYQGTADAVRKQSSQIEPVGASYTLVLAGDHLYHMDYRDLIQFHVQKKADVTVAVHPVSREEAPNFGILNLNRSGKITNFVEKPKSEESIALLECSEDPDKPCMASMGIYVFNTKALFKILKDNQHTDFGRHVIPAAIKTHRVMGYVFDGYWEDIGTVRRFFEVNLDMAAPLPKFNLYDPEHPLYTRPRFLASTKVQGGSLHNTLIADGCRIQEATIRNSVIGVRSIISQGVTVERSLIMGADYYESPSNATDWWRPGQPNVGVGPDSVIQGAIIDKNARIGRQVIIRHIPDRRDEEQDNWMARDGIVIVPKNAVIPDGTVI